MIEAPARQVPPRILCADLIEREAESAALDQLLAQATGGVPRVVLVSGDAGIGKTALVARFVARARTTGAHVLTGTCAQFESRRPFGPFVDLLRSASTEFSPGAAERAMRENAVELFRLLPEHMTSDRRVTEDSGARERVQESFVALLRDLARGSPLVVVVEDLHWADEASLELFPLLARRLRTGQLLLLATYRSDELHRRHPLRQVVAELERTRVAHALRLGPLSDEGTGAVIRSALELDRPAPADFCDAMYARCEGNPFFIEEVLRALAERGALVRAAGKWRLERGGKELATPTSVRSAVEDRVALLAPEARQMLEVAAVIGQHFDFDLLQRVTGMPEPDLVKAVRDAVGAQLVVESDTGESYFFRHALTRESVLARLLQRERRAAHLAIGEAIESLPGARIAERAEELAYHFDEAQDEARALRYHDLAASEAMRASAYARAMSHLERAVELAPPQSTLLADLELRLADSAIQSIDYSRAQRAAIAARDLYMAFGDDMGVGRALMLLARHGWLTGNQDSALDLVREAIRMLEQAADTDALAVVYTQLVMIRYFERVPGVDVAHYAERAVEIGRRVHSPWALAFALQFVGMDHLRAGRWEDAIAAFREGLQVALDNDIADIAQYGYSNLSAGLAISGVPWHEWEHIQGALEAHARRFGVRTAHFIMNSVQRHVHRGAWDEAVKMSAELADSGSSLAPVVDMCLAMVRVAREGPAGVLPELETLYQRLRGSTDLFVAPNALRAISVFVLAGEMHQALAHADVTLLGFAAAPLAVEEARFSALFAAVSARNDADIERWIESGIGTEGTSRLRIGDARRAFARGERDFRAGEVDLAMNGLADSAGILREEQLSLPETLVRLRRADMLLARAAPGDKRAAADELSLIVPFWRLVKATWYLGQLRNWAGERGLPFPRETRRTRGAAGAKPSPLTPREHEVAAHIAHGLTNRQIAEQLVISERTVEGHVEQIRSKLRLRSRALVAVWAAETRP